ncbi:MAG TPA: hypothetical protein PK076_06330 [Saprospiraceae bacterium]|nr:hypothetical protein [Saprospiraceae bacterium]
MPIIGLCFVLPHPAVLYLHKVIYLVLGFVLCYLIPILSLISGSCSSVPTFAGALLQPEPHGSHPWGLLALRIVTPEHRRLSITS